MSEQKTGHSQVEDMLEKDRNLVEFVWGLLGVLRRIPEHERGGARIKAELVYEQEGKPPKMAFKITY